ncbi:hypothetical protein TRIUR3_23064 [Triticum urartu]|uniref:Uncharacterized protein n=1 Tax=Triticum urartu TaxID=4572 RepID=M7Z015_TRIUA|nr:hypothetical protein TRIUR3_23064 [Triticum urartu]
MVDAFFDGQTIHVKQRSLSGVPLTPMRNVQRVYAAWKHWKQEILHSRHAEAPLLLAPPPRRQLQDGDYAMAASSSLYVDCPVAHAASRASAFGGPPAASLDMSMVMQTKCKPGRSRLGLDSGERGFVDQLWVISVYFNWRAQVPCQLSVNTKDGKCFRSKSQCPQEI